MLSTIDSLQTQGHIQTESEGKEKDTHANGSQNKVGVATLISEKVDFKIKTITRDKEGHYIMIKESIQEYVTIVNIYAPKISASQQIRQMLTDIKNGKLIVTQ